MTFVLVAALVCSIGNPPADMCDRYTLLAPDGSVAQTDLGSATCEQGRKLWPRGPQSAKCVLQKPPK